MKKIIFLSVCTLFFGQLNAQTDKLEVLDSLIQKEVGNQKTINAPILNSDMKNLYLLDGVPIVDLSEIDVSKIAKVEVVNSSTGFICYGNYNTVILMSTADFLKKNKQKIEPAFRVYEIYNQNWTQQEDVYNAIRSKVPGVTITEPTLNATPKITMRGDSNTIVIVDGVRYDASILNALSPADIESIKVSNAPNASVYFLGGQD